MEKIKASLKKEVVAISLLLLITLIIIILQSISLERSLIIDIESANKVLTRDDRPFNGASIGSIKKTKQGFEFSCQLIRKSFKWPYCELVINLRDSDQEILGVDLSKYDRVGLWLKHDHKNQPGTRFEIHNYNPAYSTLGDINSLKYNTIEFTEKNSHYPTWIELSSLNVPTWWNEMHDLSLDNFGTDITNAHTIAFTTGSTVNEGLYKLLLEKVEFKGKYFQTESLFLALIIIWSVAAGYFFKRFSFVNDDYKFVTQEKIKWERRASSDPLTGALNRSSARALFKKITHNKVADVSLIFLDIDHFKQVNDLYGHSVGDDVLIQFVNVINSNISEIDQLIRWGGEEFLIVSIDTALPQAIEIADQLRMAIEHSHWSENMKLTTSVGVAQLKDETITELIERADKALYKAKNTGRNKVVASS